MDSKNNLTVKHQGHYTDKRRDVVTKGNHIWYYKAMFPLTREMWYENSRMRETQLSASVVSDSLWAHDCSTPGLPVHHQLPGLAQTHGHRVGDAIPASDSFQMSELFASGGQSIRVSASAAVLPMNIQDWFPLGLSGWIFLQSKGFSRGQLKCTSTKAIHSEANKCAKNK